ncbi:MAG: hypothetical protein IIZ19_04060 [Clostridia bacterium]|nr:hypothetical protein [Clostridia bacterium]
MLEKLKTAVLFMTGTAMTVLGVILSVAPVYMLGLPLWADFIILAAIAFIPFGREALWIIALIVTVNGQQDIFAKVYYVLFAVFALAFTVPFVLSLVMTAIEKRKGERI